MRIVDNNESTVDNNRVIYPNRRNVDVNYNNNNNNNNNNNSNSNSNSNNSNTNRKIADDELNPVVLISISMITISLIALINILSSGFLRGSKHK